MLFNVSSVWTGCPESREPKIPRCEHSFAGPGWWLTTDGNWHPQRWETTFTYCTHESLQAVIAEASRQTQAYGQQGWEIVGSSVQRVQVAHHFRDYDKGGDLLFEWSIVSTLKRPLPPG